jgi:hypothetical protein
MWRTRVVSFFAAALATSIVACSIGTVAPQFDLPVQSLNTEIPAGHTAVVFFNASSWLTHGLDRSGKVNVAVSGKNLASLWLGEYVLVMLPPGEYFVSLAHWDLATFTSSHALTVKGERTFVKVYATLTSNGLEVLEAQPPDFERSYEPAL